MRLLAFCVAKSWSGLCLYWKAWFTRKYRNSTTQRLCILRNMVDSFIQLWTFPTHHALCSCGGIKRLRAIVSVLTEFSLQGGVFRRVGSFHYYHLRCLFKMQVSASLLRIWISNSRIPKYVPSIHFNNSLGNLLVPQIKGLYGWEPGLLLGQKSGMWSTTLADWNGLESFDLPFV